MRRSVWPLAGLLFFYCVLSPLRAEEDYSVLFGAKYAAAEEFLRQNSWISAALRLPPQETRIALAVVFPEIIRFKSLEDRIQVRALKVLYVQYGRKYADFSVGHFQMKPTFAEQIERDYNRLFSAEEKTAAEIAPFDTGDSSALRKERVVRLDDLQWQGRYLRLFMMVMGRFYQSRAFDDDLEKLRFYATAYTTGYAKGEKAIRRIMPTRHFHVQLLLPKTHYCYADIAVFYFIRQTAPATRVPGLAGEGYQGALQRAAETLVARSRTTYVTPWQIGTLYTRAGKNNEALEWLEKAYEAHDPNMPYLSVDPIFDDLRADPRFQDILRRMNLQK